MPRTPHTFIASYLLLIKDGEVLLLRRCNTGYRDGDYSVPAGHVEPGESLTQTMIRETKEEIGVTLNEKNIRVSHIMHRMNEYQDRESIDTFFIAEQWTGTPENMEQEKCDDLSWFPISDLPKNTIPYIKKAIESSLQGIMYSEFGWK